MSNWQKLHDLLNQHKNRNKEQGLIQQIAHNYGLYSLTGYSKWGLALFILRSSHDVWRSRQSKLK